MVRRLGWHLNIPGGSLGDDSGEGCLAGQPSTSVNVDMVTCSVVRVVHMECLVKILSCMDSAKCFACIDTAYFG